MEVSSMILCKGYTTWQGLLLTASLLTYWYLPTTAQVTIELVPPNVFQGENVRLEVHNLPEDFLAFAWYRGVTNMKRGIAVYAKRKSLNATGPVYNGRQTVYSDGSLLLQRVILKDTGFYTLRVISRQGEIVSTTSVFLHVQISILTCGGRTTSDQPTIEIVPPNVAEGANVLLLARDLPENLQFFFWYKGVISFITYEIARHTIDKNSSFPGPAHSGRETVYSNGSLLLHNVTLDDIGFYTLKTVTRDMKLELIHGHLQVNASISTCCNTLSSAQLTVETGSQHVVKGQSIVLLLHNLPEDLLGFSWYKGLYAHQPFKIVTYDRAMNSITWGPVSSSREMLHTNGSLLLQGITEKDAGIYTILTLNRDLRIGTIYVQLHVNKPVTEPFLQVTDTTVTVQSSVVFSCLSTDTRISIRWLFNNQSLQLTERMTLSPTKCGLSIDPVRMEDAGYYKCEVSNSFSSETSLPVRLMNFTRNDTGFYTLRTLTTDLKAGVAHVQLRLDTSHCRHHLTSSQITIESVPPSVVEGESVLLVAHNLPENLRAIFWYKGVTVFKNHEVAQHIIGKNSSVLGPAHSGREMVYSNGSLLLQNFTKNDTGIYTLRTLTTNLKAGVVHVQLRLDTSLSTCCNLFTSVQLMIEPVPQNPVKGESILLLVHNLPKDLQTFSWYKSFYSTQSFKIAEYRGAMNSITWGPAYSRREIVYINGSLLLQDVMEKDAGFYTLQTLNRDFKTENTHIQFHVYNCRLPPTTAQLTIQSMPPNAVEGKNILLVAHNVPENLRSFVWYRGATTVNRHGIAQNVIATNRSLLGPAHSGREVAYPNGSLLLHNVTQKDTGFYTLRTLNTQLETQETQVYLHIYKPVTQPFIRVTNTKAIVQSSVVLTCLSADTGISTRWIFNNRSLQLTKRMTLSMTKCQLRIDSVRRQDAGEYQCEVSNPVSSKTSLPFRLVVMNE